VRFSSLGHWQEGALLARLAGAQRRWYPWLAERGSLTARLVARCQQFRVQKLMQAPALCLADEQQLLGLRSRQKIHQREVLLRCDGQIMVYGHTCVPWQASASEWPAFSSLGERSLGSTLFYDPLVQRGELEFASLSRQHPLRQRLAQVHPASLMHQRLWARRSLFFRKGGRLLVTELFLPEVLELPDTPLNFLK